MSYYKDKYKKFELSYYEIQIIVSILDETKHNKRDWFSEISLEDVKHIFDRKRKEIIKTRREIIR